PGPTGAPEGSEVKMDDGNPDVVVEVVNSDV
ncbi:hypothetical protein A2U01_0085741, partial [Trifolium medium]|nr:hypothetical protein [Trifolium medium]